MQDPDDPLLIIRAPSVVRYFEPVALSAFFLAAILLPSRLRPRPVRRVGGLLALLVGAGVVGGALSYPGFTNLAYGIYATAVPLMLLVTSLLYGYDEGDLAWYGRYLAVLCTVNWTAGLYQIVHFGLVNAADNVHGILGDANVMSTVLYFFICYLLFAFVGTRRRKWLVAALVLMPVAYLGFNEKLNWFFLVFVPPAVLLRLRARAGAVVAAVALGVLVMGGTVVLAARQGLTTRTAAVAAAIVSRGSIFDLGLFQSYVSAWRQVRGSPATIAVGVGPSNYGGSVASSRFNRGEATAVGEELFGRGHLQKGAYDSPVNFFANVLAEFGLVGCVAIAAFLVYVLRRLWVIARVAAEPRLTAWATAAIFGWLMVAWQAAWVPFGVFEDLAAVTPIALVTAMLLTASDIATSRRISGRSEGAG